MATYKRFEDLPVWQSPCRLYELCDDFLVTAPARMRSSFRDQLERAVLSVSNNIAEGFERGTTNELLAFIYIARGSSGEVRSMLTVVMRREWMAEFKSQISELIDLAESCSRQLHAWAQSLQNSDIAGQRRLDDQSRTNWERRETVKVARQNYSAMERELVLKLPADHPLRRLWESKHGPLE